MLAGAAAAGLASVAAGRPWAEASATVAGTTRDVAADGSDVAPLALALALVALAAWGAVLVLRRRGRRTAALLGVAAAAGAAGTALSAYGRAEDEALAQLGQPEFGEAMLTAWYFATPVGALVSAALFVVAVVRAGHWPEMGTRYDAPGGGEGLDRKQENLWTALDEGHDPTA